MTIFAQTLTNPGAESGTTGWTVYTGTGTLVAAPPGHSGSNSFGISGAFQSDTKFAQEIAVDVSLEAPIDAGTAAVGGTCYFLNDGGDGGQFYIEFYDAANALIESKYLTTQTNTSWELQEIYWPIPPLTRFVRIGAYSLRLTGSIFNVHWDDFTLDISDDGQADWPDHLAPKSLQVAVYAWSSFPSEQLRNSQAASYVWGASEESTGLFQVRSHQVALYAWVRGYVEQPHVRAWTFSLDGHDFYVLRLGTISTVVLDLVTGQWAEWDGHSLPYWRAVKGQNWLGMGPDTANRLYGTNVVAGDDRVGTLWMLDPTAGVDDGPTDDSAQVAYTRSVTGVIPMRMRQTAPTGGVYVTLSLGEPTITGAAITLRISDDWGKSYSDMGTITIDPSDYSQEIAWRSLGLIRAPGRVFELTDDGAAVRIGNADMK